MYLIFGLGVIAKALFWIAVTILLALIAVNELFGGPYELPRLAGYSVAFAAVLLPAFGACWGVWGLVLRRFGWFNRLVYPDLNGVWRGTIRSNWPIIERTVNAAAGRTEPFDPFDGRQPFPALQDVVLTLRIKADWFTISVEALEEDGHPRSRTLAVVPKKDGPAGVHELYLVFLDQPRTPKATDDLCNLGAMQLVASWDGKPRLQGRYWTNRAWHKGLNTAGVADFVRVPDGKADAGSPP